MKDSLTNTRKSKTEVSRPFTSVGGQAVMEGVMMRSPHFITVAVRRPNQRIVLQTRPYESLSQRYPIFKKPIFRGVLTLLESMVQGMGALNYSAQIASEEITSEKEGSSPAEGTPKAPSGAISDWAFAGTIVLSIVLGLGLFVAFPHLMTVFLTAESGFNIPVESPLFHLIDGGIKMGVLLAYMYLIAFMKDIHRVFQYHGAEHKSIYAFEAGEELTVENARKYTTLHPRCGTSFLLFLVVISVLVFSVVFPIFGLSSFSSNPILNHTAMILLKVVLMLPVSGLAYEFIKACAFRMDSPVFRILIWPGMILQKLTTREPSDDQLEVALASLKQVLKAEPGKEIEIATLADLGETKARVGEFLEV